MPRELTVACKPGASRQTRMWWRKAVIVRAPGKSISSNWPIGAPITVCHYPPGTSKWSKIEHRLFYFISMNWRGLEKCTL